MNPDDRERLDARVRELETVVRALRAELDAAVPPPHAAETVVPQPQPQPQPLPVPPPAAPPPATAPYTAYEHMFGQPPPAARAPATGAPVHAAAPRPARSLEGMLAGRGLQLVGLLLVLLGAGFFLNVAIARGWLGPAEQVLLALAAGTALLAFAARRIGADLTFLAEGLIGLGAAIDYLALWASVAVFHELHVPRALALAGMIAVTAVLAMLAVRRRSERIALMGLFGGYLTPLLLTNGDPDRALLAAYLLILSGTMLAIAVRSSFRWVEVLTFAAVVCYAPVFAIDPPRHWGAMASASVGTAFFAVFAIAFTLAALSDGKVTKTRLTLLGLDTVGYAIVLETVFANQPTVLGTALLVLAAVLLGTARFAPLPPRLASAYFYLGLSAATLALPALLNAFSLLDAVAVEAGLLALIGTRRSDGWVLLASAALFAVTGCALLVDALTDPPQHAALNSLVLAFAIDVAALAFALSRLHAAELPRTALVGWRNLGLIALNAIALAGLSRECVDVLGGPRGMDGLSNEGQFGLSAVWTLYATGLFAAGMARREPLLRWLALGLFGCTVFKVFTVDLASLDVVYRILSFVGLGIVLVGVSAWYQRTMARQKAAEADA